MRKPSKWDRATKYARENADSAAVDVFSAEPAEFRRELMHGYLYRAWVVGYERAKREVPKCA